MKWFEQVKELSRKPWIAVVIVTFLVVTTPLSTQASDHVDLPDGLTLKLGNMCPVCGMKVGGELGAEAIYAYSETKLVGFAGASASVFENGSVVGFDGARCLFVYNTIPKRFGIDVTKIKNSYVTDFTTRKFIDVNDAFFVMGTKVLGFMGYDLIPFSTKAHAEQFMTEYGGKRIIQRSSARPEDVDRPKKE